MIAQKSFIPQSGERAFICGQTGSGKTAFACFLVMHIPIAPVIIYDTKDEEKFPKLPNSVIVSSMEECQKEFHNEKIDYIIVRPPMEIIDEPAELDKYLIFHYHNFHHSTAYIDEAYSFHLSRGRAGKGIVALYTRGRSRGITTILSSQRPKNIDRFCITEAQKAYIFRLIDRDDRSRLNDIVPNFDKLPLPPRFGFYFFETGEDNPILMQPINLDPLLDTGYTSIAPQEHEGESIHNENPATKHVWI